MSRPTMIARRRSLAKLPGCAPFPPQAPGRGPERSDALEQPRHALPDADAQAREAAALSSPSQLEGQVPGHARARGAERVAERDRATVDVDAVVRDRQVAQHGERL